MTSLVEWLIQLVKGARPWFIVQPWERAVLTRCGRNARLVESGIHARLPYLDEVKIINTRQRVSVIPDVTVSTKDGKTITVAGAVGFHIADPLATLLAIQDPENNVAAHAQGAIVRYVVALNVSELDIADLGLSVLEAMVGRMAGLGLAFDFVSLCDFTHVRAIRLLQAEYRPHTGYTEL